MHGKDATPESKWYPWFREEMITRDHEYVAPILPQTSNPVLAEWIVDLAECQPDGNTVIVAHSRGGVATLRFLESAPADLKIRALILIATNRSEISERSRLDEENNGFYTSSDYDFAKIRSHCDTVYVLHSTDDEWVPYSAGEHIAKGLQAKFLSFDQYGHFGRLARTVPELLEIIDGIK